MQLNIESAIFIVFLLLNLVVGLSYGSGVKTIKDYALGGRNFSTIALVSTIVATSITGSGFFVDLSNTYSKGLPYIVASLAWCLQFFIIGVFLVPRMAEFIGTLTVAEMMGNLYGKNVRFITAICGILCNIGIIAVQFKVFGSLVHYFIGVSHSGGIIIAATIVILYSAFGGIRAVTYTDMLQFFTFGFVIPMVGMLIWNEFHGLDLTVNQALQNPLFHYQSIVNLRGAELFDFIFLFIYFLIPALSSADFQRISMGRDVKQVKKAFMISLVIILFITLAVMWVPFLIANIDPNVDSSNLIGYIINNYSYSGLRVLIIIGVSAMAMSSADSFINNSAILFAHDLKDLLNIKIDKLILSKVFAILSGTFAIYLALSTNDLLDMVRSTAGFYMAVVTVPLIFTILGFRSSMDSVLMGMLTAFSVVMALMILKADEVIVPGMIINMIVLFGYHYIYKQPGGWIGIKDKSYLEQGIKERKRRVTNFTKSLKVSKFIQLFKNTIPKDEMMYTWLGIYCIFFTLSTMYSTQTELRSANGQIILVIYQIMMCTGVITAMYPIWPPRIKYEIVMQVAWNIIIFYMLVFFSCFFAMLSDFGPLQFSIFTMNLIITALLVGWKLSLGMIAIGFYCSVMFYKYYTGFTDIDISIGSPQFIFMYSLMLIGSGLIIFLKPRQEHQQLIEAQNLHLNERMRVTEQEAREALAIRGEFIRNVTHEYHTPMTAITSLAETLWAGYDNLPREIVKSSLECIFKSAKNLETFDNNIASLSRLGREGYSLKLKQISVNSLLSERIDLCRKLYEEDKEDREWSINIGRGIKINGDRYHLEQVFDNLIINAISYCPKGRITINLAQDKKTNQINFSIEDDGIGIPKEELYDIFSEFVVSSKTKTPAGGRGIGLALCKRVIEVHKGAIWVESNGYRGTKFSFKLPG
jgi:Na+/proline symporter/signal transduction histidine kinase